MQQRNVIVIGKELESRLDDILLDCSFYEFCHLLLFKTDIVKAFLAVGRKGPIERKKLRVDNRGDYFSRKNREKSKDLGLKYK